MKKFVLKAWSQAHYVDDVWNYGEGYDEQGNELTEGEDLFSHFFHFQFECDGEIVIIGYHLFRRFSGGSHWDGRRVYASKSLNHSESKELNLDFDVLNSKNKFDVEDVINEIMGDDFGSHWFGDWEGYDDVYDEEIGKEFFI